MTQTTAMNPKAILRMLLVLALALVALPLLALLAFGIRFLLPVVLLAGAVAWVASPAFRAWFIGEAEGVASYHGFDVPALGLWAHGAHSWARFGRHGRAEVGIDDLVQRALGMVEAVDAPMMGMSVKQGERLFTLVHAGRRLEVKAPVSGVVRAINPAVIARPALVNEQPYGAGWVVRLDTSGARAGLRRGSSAQEWYRGEVDRLMALMSPGGAAAPAMADGGVVSSDLAAQIDDQRWEQLRASMF